jgi:YD repeat-containing protein
VNGTALSWTYLYNGDDLATACSPRSTPSQPVCTSYAYDGHNRITGVTDHRGIVQLRATYTATGEVASRSDGSGNLTAFAYSHPGMVTITDPLGHQTVDRYDNQLRLVSVTDAAGHVSRFGYDPVTGLRNLATDPAGGSYRWTYDPQGDETSETNPDLYTSFFTYDSNGNLVQSRGPRSTSPTDDTYLTTYTYDANGDRLTDRSPALPGFPDGVTTRRTFSTGSESAVGGGTVPAGLVLSETDPRGASTSYGYTAAGDLATTTEPSGAVVSLAYDALGRRISSSTVSDAHPAGVTTRYAYLADGQITEVQHPVTVDPITGTSHQLVEKRSYDLDGNVVTVTRIDAPTGSAS